ncbi:MAG: UDP-2,3-diacylglucosamine diphosphatase LpxI [Hyphomicrobium sp.]|nr:UDP-2,3-diacylglucosamine diphosphatase LpxI [Hyphomicrobium sp.]
MPAPPQGMPSPIGVIACGGTMPGEVIDAITRRGAGVHIIAIAEEADAAFGALPVVRLSWSKYGAALASLKRAGVRDVVMVGRMTRPRLRDARPDLGFLTAIPSVMRIMRAGGDDALLRAVVQLFEPHGFRVVGVADVAPDLLIGDGVLAGPEPTAADTADIAIGMAVIDALGPFDIGQAAVVADGRVLALEGAEGTDRTLARVAQSWQRSGGDRQRRCGVLVKQPKPGQDLRVDLPTIGPETVLGVAAAGLRGIAAESGLVIAAHRARLIENASNAEIFVIGVAAQVGDGMAASRAQGDRSDVRDLLARAPDSWRGDAILGADVMQTLADFDIDAVLVVRRHRVISIGVNEAPIAVMGRTHASRRGLWRRRSGVAVFGPKAVIDSGVLEAISAIGLAALVIASGSGQQQAQAVEAHGKQARQLGIALVALDAGKGGRG